MRQATRRQFLEVAGGAAVLSLADCAAVTSRRPAAFVARPRALPLLVGLNGAPYGQPLPAETYRHLEQWAPPGRGVILRSPVRSYQEALLSLMFTRTYEIRELLLVERPDLELVASLAGLPAWGVELVNEPNLDTRGFTALTPAAFGAFVRDSRAALRAGGFGGHIVSGGVWNTDADGLDYVRKALPYWEPAAAASHDEVWLGLHWYHDAGVDVRGQVQQALGTRPLLVTEFGMPARDATSERAQAAYVDAQLAAFETLDTLVGAVGYQLPCGLDTRDDLNNFGIQRLDGTWRPADAVFARWAQR